MTGREVGVGGFLRSWVGPFSFVTLLMAGLCWALPSTVWAQVAPSASGTYQFRALAGPPPLWLAESVLSAADRAYIAQLPEIRVALQRVGAPPFERVADSGEISGLQAELLVYLANTLGLRVRPLVYADWTSVLEAVRSGAADMVLTAAVTQERLQYMTFTLGTVAVPVALIGRQGLPPVAPERARIVLERDYFTGDLVRRRYSAASVSYTPSTLQALKAVAAGQADLYVGSFLEVLDLLGRQPVPGLEVQQILAAGATNYHFGLRKDLARLVPLLNKGIADFRALPHSSAAAAAAMGQAASGLPPGWHMPQGLSLSTQERQVLADRSVWRVGAVRGLALLNDVDAQGQHTGIAADYLAQVAARLGVALDTVPFDSVAQMLDALRAGQIDVVPFLTYTAARARDFGFSVPYLDMPYVLVGRTDMPLYWDLASLRGKRLALAAQHPLREELARIYPGIQLVDAANGNEAMDMVALGDADAAVEVKLFANLRINGDGAGRLRALGEVADLPAQFRFATSADSRPLVALIDSALADIPNLERERMLRRWVAVDLVPAFPWRRHLPTLVAAGAALALLAGLTLWWMRLLSIEVKERRRMLEQLDDIGRSVPGLIFRYVLDERGGLKDSWYSCSAETFLGAMPPPKTMLLSLLEGRMQPEQYQAARIAQKQSFESQQRFNFTAQINTATEGERWVHTEAAPSVGADGERVWTGYMADVTEQKALQTRLAHDARQRHLMLASASHELRSPTHTLGLALQSVSDEGLPEADRQRIGIARDAASTLSQLLDDVLDTARLDAGALKLHTQDVALRPLLAEVAIATHSAAQKKGLTFVFHLDQALPSRIQLDPLRVKQVLTNLLSNAVKYTDAGRVSLRVVLASLDNGRPALALQVKDTGVGIAPADQLHLFEPFVTVGHGVNSPGPAQGEAGGRAHSSGLGLSICRRLVQLMGGHLELASQAGVGTRITVRLPLRGASRAGSRGGSAGVTSEMRQTPTGRVIRSHGALLVCDDDDVSRILLVQMLQAMGHNVLQARDGDEALALCQAGGVRLLITDLDMPGLDGMALIAQLQRAERAWPERTAVVICSGRELDVPKGNSDADGHADGHAAGDGSGALGVDAYLIKPLQRPVLESTLTRLLAPAPLAA